MTAFKKNSLLKKLCNRGDEINIVNGHLFIQANSKKEVPKEWLIKNKVQLVSEIAELLSIDVYIYDSYSTGQYGKYKSQGVTLQFLNIRTGEAAYVVFNASLKRVRNSHKNKAGGLLPKGQFRVTKNRAFYKFWFSTGLKIPPRLSSFHSYMGNLKVLFFIPDPNVMGKITNKIIPRVNVKHDQLVEMLDRNLIDNSQTICIQPVDKEHTALAYKEVPQGHANKGVEGDINTGREKCGTSLNGNAVISAPLPRSIYKVPPSEQTREEWLRDYDKYQ